MPIGNLSKPQQETYVDYNFSYVKCVECGEQSENFVTKDHLTADESVEYIQQITGFILRRVDGERVQSFVTGNGNSDKGGLICPICQDNILKKEVV